MQTENISSQSTPVVDTQKDNKINPNVQPPQPEFQIRKLGKVKEEIKMSKRMNCC